LSRLMAAALLISTCNNSAANTKSNGDNGSPYRTPCLHLKNLLGTPLRRTADDPDPRMLRIQFTHLTGKPICSIIRMITKCSTVSNAFSKSSFKMIACLLDWWQWCMYSKLHANQSCMVRVWMKPYWLRCMSPTITTWRWSARILVTNLRLMFMSEIGL
jgi:hypothetical protein